MKIADRTPFRNKSGQVDVIGQIRGTIKFGLNWYARIQAQDTVFSVLDKVLSPEYILLRNITLPDTEIDLPMVLIGPPGVFLINVVYQRGVFRVRDDEWGTILGEKFIPVGTNQIQRTIKLGRVLQIYLDRAGYKDDLVVDPILIAPDPGMQIVSVRPAVRIVLSEALERFAISMNQGRPILPSAKITEIAQTIIYGPSKNPRSVPDIISPFSNEEDESKIVVSEYQSQEPHPAFNAETLGFSFEETGQKQEDLLPLSAQALTIPNLRSDAISPADNPSQPGTGIISYSSSSYQTSGDDRELENDRLSFYQLDAGALAHPHSDIEEALELLELDEPNSNTVSGLFNSIANKTDTSNQPDAPTPKKNNILGMTKGQVLILGGILFFWLCTIAGFSIYVYLNR